MNIEDENEPRPLRIIGTPRRLEDNKYVFDDPVFAILNKECGWICPSCYNEVRITPTEAGEHVFKCMNKLCKATFTLRIDAEATTFLVKKKPSDSPSDSHAAGAASGPAAVGAASGPAAVGAAGVLAVQQQVHKPARGILLMAVDDDGCSKRPPAEQKQEQQRPEPQQQEEQAVQHMAQAAGPDAVRRPTGGTLQWGGFFSRKHFKLSTGSTFIGRKDKKTPSDIEFDDPEMSRRSVVVNAVSDGQGGFSFTLVVQKALNPVKVNDRKLLQGESVTLKHNDAIVMGKTTLTFKCS